MGGHGDKKGMLNTQYLGLLKVHIYGQTSNKFSFNDDNKITKINA